MEKRLSDRIKIRQSHKSQPQSLKNKVSFLALKQDIQEALQDGWAMKNIWETLFEEQKINFSYKTFRLYVHRLILGSTQPVAQKKHNQIDPATPPVIDEMQIQKSMQQPAQIVDKPVFRYNPTPNIEDLI